MKFFLLCLLPFLMSGPVKKGLIHAGNLQIYYESIGRGPAVLLLHGGYLDLHSWDDLTDKLKGAHLVIRIDLPGHVGTIGSDSTIAIADVIRVVLDSLKIGRVSIVGLSLGGSCGLDFALTYPERMEKLVLVSSGLSGWNEVMKLDSLSLHLFNQADSAIESKDDRVAAETFTHIWFDGPYRKPGQMPVRLRSYIYRTVDQNIREGSRVWPVFDKNKAAKRAKNVDCPTLILAGDKDLPFILSVANYLHGQIKNSTFHIFQNSAHMINLEQPEKFDRIVGEFLAQKK